MLAAVLTIVAGLVIGVLGLVLPDLYVIGLLLLGIGGVGVVVRSAQWLRATRE